jgi:hypothetical protein
MRMMRATMNQAETPPANSAKIAVASAEDEVFVAEGAHQHAPRRAERLQHHRIVRTCAVSGCKRAGKHQNRGDERDRGRGADGSRELGDQRVDDIDRILDPNAGDRRIGCW